MSDVTCAHCGEPWDVYGLRHESMGYIEQPEEAPTRAAGENWQAWALYDDDDAGKLVCNAIYRAVLSGRGCPSCGFDHEAEGQYRTQQMEELVYGSVTDDDVTVFL